jgi:RNA polymerase sigma-70 factor (ECF subfamily)
VNDVEAGSPGFAEWYAQEHARLFASILVFAGDRMLAAEATDEAFSRALERWDRVGRMDSPAGWTYRVAVNIVQRARRRRALELRVLPRLARREEVPAPEGEIWEAVRGLAPRQRLAVALRYISDLAENDIAQVMGVTRGTVASTLADARRLLAAALADPDVAEDLV